MLRWMHSLQCAPHRKNNAYEHWKKQPTKTVNNRFRPPETDVARRQGRLARPRNVIWPTWGYHPKDFRFDRRCFLFFRRHAGHELGVENTRIGPTRPYVPQSFFVGVFSSPHTKQTMFNDSKIILYVKKTCFENAIVGPKPIREGVKTRVPPLFVQICLNSYYLTHLFVFWILPIFDMLMFFCF